MAAPVDWTPPAELRPITPEAYALLRVYVDAATAAAAQYIDRRKSGCQNLGEALEGPQGQDCRLSKTKPDMATMGQVFYQFVPFDSLPIDRALELREVMGYSPEYDFAAWERPGWVMWADRDAALKALEAVTPAEVRAALPLEGPPDAKGKLAALPSALEGGIEWWSIALAVGGVLAFLGRRSLAGLALSLVPRTLLRRAAALLLKALVFGGAIALLTTAGKKIIGALASGGGSVLWMIGAVAVGGGAIYLAVRSARASPPTPVLEVRNVRSR